MNILFFLKPKSELAYIYDYHTLRQAMEIMEYHKYSSVPIINREGKYMRNNYRGGPSLGAEGIEYIEYKGCREHSSDPDSTAFGLSSGTRGQQCGRFDRPGHGAEFCSGGGRIRATLSELSLVRILSVTVTTRLR